MRLRVPAEPKDDVVDKEVIVIEDSEDEVDSNSCDTFESDDDQGQEADDEPETFIENDTNEPNEESRIEQDAAATLMAFFDRGDNDSLIEEIPWDRHQSYQPRPVPRPGYYFAHLATRSTYFITQGSTSEFPQRHPTYVVSGYAPCGIPHPSYPTPFAPVVTTRYSIVQTPGYYPPPLQAFDGLHPQPVLAYATRGYEQYMDGSFGVLIFFTIIPLTELMPWSKS
ncbi:hypothetical protein CEP54_015326 [Fusarium duplospermum]|uniref:Uncharacterized protein n=1 Tax=Fusarium duplospermum TaxID=1325734 RepID=A0A428NPY1_9HYPO|nr:hypothetical protein CEP54_015326 [Fusarium duplospermum]